MNDADRQVAPIMPAGQQIRGERIDRLGAVASSLCAVHCAFCALLPAAFGALGLGVLLGHEAEWVFTLFAVAFAIGALLLGWRRHRSALVAGLFLLGITGLLGSRGLEMSGGHHDQHGASQHGASHHNATSHAERSAHVAAREHEHHEDEPSSGHAEDHHEHEGSLHLIGGIIGVLAGALLFAGHILNIRTGRRCQEECCT